jgi:hypothetical protein
VSAASTALEAAKLVHDTYGYGTRIEVAIEHNDRALPSQSASIRVTHRGVSVFTWVDHEDAQDIADFLVRRLRGAMGDAP